MAEEENNHSAREQFNRLFNTNDVVEEALQELREVYKSIFKVAEIEDRKEVITTLTSITEKRAAAFEKMEKGKTDFHLLLSKLKSLKNEFSFTKAPHKLNTRNVYFALARIEDAIKLLEFNHFKKEGECNCELRKRIQLPFNDSTHKQLRLLMTNDSDPYGDVYSVYECNSCQMKWVHETIAGGDDGPRWMNWNEKNYPLNN